MKVRCHGLRWLAGNGADTAFGCGLAIECRRSSESGVCPYPSPTALQNLAGLRTVRGLGRVLKFICVSLGANKPDLDDSANLSSIKRVKYA